MALPLCRSKQILTVRRGNPVGIKVGKRNGRHSSSLLASSGGGAISLAHDDNRGCVWQECDPLVTIRSRPGVARDTASDCAAQTEAAIGGPWGRGRVPMILRLTGC